MSLTLEEHALQATERWYEQATVRWAGTFSFSEKPVEGIPRRNEYFALESIHPILLELLKNSSLEKVLQFELHQLYRHLKFTTLLEHKLVLPALQDIAFEKLGTSISKELVLQAFRLITDEAFHGQRSEELIASLEDRTGVKCPHEVSPNLYLNSLCDTADDQAARLRRFYFCFVSETIISSTLAKNSKGINDAQVDCFFREHLRDENAHSVFFRAVFSVIWRQTTRASRLAVADFFGQDIRSFIAPDWSGVDEDLHAAGLIEESMKFAELRQTNPLLDGYLALDSARVTISSLMAIDYDRLVLESPSFLALNGQ